MELPGRFVRITHPFHPHFGREFELVDHRESWGDDRLYINGDDGGLKRIPTLWTDRAPPDAFVMAAQGRAHFRLDDLRGLAELLDGLRPRASKKRGSRSR